jgi:hypothetical protein
MTETGTHRALITVLGLNPKDAIYELAGRTHEARLAPIALLALDDEPFDEVIALCTSEAAAARVALGTNRRGSTGRSSATPKLRSS